jgi:hypothetical protein
MTTLIIPCAGRSTRFGTSKPKYMITHPSGNLMLIEAIKNLKLENVSTIIITVVKQHVEDTKLNLIKLQNDLEFLLNKSIIFYQLDSFTSSQSETVYRTIKKFNIKDSIFIKDCDNTFDTTINNTNAVCVSLLESNVNAINKSYTSVDKYGNISGIVEKKVISNMFCVGGYSFKSGYEFIKSYEELITLNIQEHNEIYISHVIQHMILSGNQFLPQQVNNYSDWGTLEDWEKYKKQFRTFFIDLDGVLVENGSEYFLPVWGESKPLNKNIELINSLYSNGKTQIIIVTARKEEFKEKTIEQLKSLNVKYHQIIFNMMHAQRILINDYSNTNKYPSALSINLKRDDDSLVDLL